MLILLVGLAFLILSFSSYAIAFQINGINRVVMSTPVTIFETSILHDTNDYDSKVLLTKSLVEEKLDKYYTNSLTKFTDKFDYELYFYNKSDYSMCVSDDCDAVEIIFTATLVYNYQYKRTLHYEVFKSNYES